MEGGWFVFGHVTKQNKAEGCAIGGQRCSSTLKGILALTTPASFKIMSNTLLFKALHHKVEDIMGHAIPGRNTIFFLKFGFLNKIHY
jgi:hypothetical protein